MNLLRLFVFGTVVMVLCVSVTPVTAQEEDGQRINLFDRKKKDKSTERVKRTVNSDLERRIIQAIQSAGDPEARNNRKAILFYGGFFAGLAVVIVALVGLQMWRRKRIEWALNDPSALVQELNFVHQLTDNEKQFMQELSERYALSSPLKLFVEPKYLLETRDNDTYVSSRPSVQLLLSKLFDITPDNRSAALESGSGAETVDYPQEGAEQSADA